MNIEPVRRDAAQLIGLAEAVADLADEQQRGELARFARRAAGRFQASVITADRTAVAVFRYEAEPLLRAG